MNLDGLSAKEISDLILVRAMHRRGPRPRTNWLGLSFLLWLAAVVWFVRK